MNYFFKSLILITVLINCSCLAPGEYSPVNTYDLGLPEATNIKLSIGSIDQSGPYNSRMLYRVTPQKLEINEFERWTQSPDLILNSYLKKAFRPARDLTLEGEIISFENNLVTEQALFIFQFKIIKGGLIIAEDTFRGEAPSSYDSEDFAEAMSGLANELVQAVIKKIKQ